MDDQLSWRNAYGMEGIYGLGALVVTFLLLEDDPQHNTVLDASEATIEESSAASSV